MISRFFKTSKPIHFVIVSAYLVIMFLVFRLKSESDFSFSSLVSQFPMILVLIGTIFLLDFFVRKNDLTLKNSYKILVYTLLLVALPVVFKSNNILIANLLIFIALRRIVSVRSQINVKKKLFDAAFWISVASLIYFWSILFFILIFSALVLYGISQIKNWIIPFVGFITVLILITTYHLIIGDSFEVLLNYTSSLSLDFRNYNDVSLIITLSIILALSLWALLIFVSGLKNKPRAIRPSFILVIIAMLIGFAIVILTPDKDGSELIFVLASLTIVIVNYIERIQKIWISETLIWLLILLPQIGLIS